jgi:hypothetical protein
MVKEFEGIPLDDVWKLPVRQFLNDLLFLKMERQKKEHLEKLALEKMKQQYGKR